MLSTCRSNSSHPCGQEEAPGRGNGCQEGRQRLILDASLAKELGVEICLGSFGVLLGSGYLALDSADNGLSCVTSGHLEEGDLGVVLVDLLPDRREVGEAGCDLRVDGGQFDLPGCELGEAVDDGRLAD
jgi:hypothetical protein